MKKILLAPNSFKECAGSVEIGSILNERLSLTNGLNITNIPISDGGDGFLEVSKNLFSLRTLTYNITTPYNNELMDCSIGYSDKMRQLFIESASIIGLHKIPIEKRHPLLLNSKGLGELFKQIVESKLNVDKVTIGIGGTGTTDLGLGLCSVFGLELIDNSGKKLDVYPYNFCNAKDLIWEKAFLPFEIELIVDVDNPLLGAAGSSRTFASQKGATNQEVDLLENGFNNIIKILKNKGLGLSDEALSGAGGGLAAGLQVFFDAIVFHSDSFINNKLLWEQDISEFDFVITGEGTFNSQSIRNKGAGVIINICAERNIPVFLICGKIEPDALSGLKSKIIPIELSSFFNGNISDSIKNYKRGLELAADKIISIIDV